MVTQLRVDQIEILPGQQLVLHQVDWDQFEAILADLGDPRGTRIAYHRGTLEIRMPLTAHERVKVLLGDFLKILLDERGLDWESLGSTTFKHPTMQAGLQGDAHQSLCLPGLVVEELSPFLLKWREMPMSQLRREFQAWLRREME